jgi:hypothetical protein
MPTTACVVVAVPVCTSTTALRCNNSDTTVIQQCVVDDLSRAQLTAHITRPVFEYLWLNLLRRREFHKKTGCFVGHLDERAVYQPLDLKRPAIKSHTPSLFSFSPLGTRETNGCESPQCFDHPPYQQYCCHFSKCSRNGA